jgi:hypothetical protein
MSSSGELIGLGMPPKLAGLVGNLPSAKTGVGTAQSGAAPITTNFTVLTTAGGTTAFLLPTVPAGSGPYIVANPSATTALIYPPSGGTIQGGSADAAFSVAQNKTAMFFKTSATAWVVNLTA